MRTLGYGPGPLGRRRVPLPTAFHPLADTFQETMIRFRSALAALACSGFALVVSAAPARADIVGLVRGTLTRADHRPIARATVTLAGDRATLTAVTGTDGRFAFARVPFALRRAGRDARRRGPSDR
jgi:hypothetical protein